MAKAIKEAEPPVLWFKATKQLGEVRLLPSDIDPRVLIRKPKMARHCGGYGSCAEFSIVCMLNPRTRTISINLATSQTKGIRTPKIIFQYDINYLNPNTCGNIGYLYLPTKDSGTLAEILKDPRAFNFTHVYDPSGFMCLTNREHDSPRVLNNVFWDSSFGYCWGGDGGTSKESFEKYIAQRNSNRDAGHKKVLSNYTDFFETDKKPMAVFTSSNPKILAKAGDSIFPGKNYVAGFAWFVKNRWWVYLKDNVFLRLTPEQVKAI